jgi:hypothetical protein
MVAMVSSGRLCGCSTAVGVVLGGDTFDDGEGGVCECAMNAVKEQRLRKQPRAGLLDDETANRVH